MKEQIAADLGAAVTKTAPAVSVSAATAAGLTNYLGSAQLLVYALTALLVSLQVGHLLWKWRCELRKVPE